jgi:hypothetical protein
LVQAQVQLVQAQVQLQLPALALQPVVVEQSDRTLSPAPS